MKRVREGEPDPGEYQGVQSSATTHPPNEFGQWLLENIYKYAKVRDSDELKVLWKAHDALVIQYDKLLRFTREVVEDADYAIYPQFCSDCGDTRVKDQRAICGRCRDAYVSCWQCVPRHCTSRNHRLCIDCFNDEFEDADDVVCTGENPDGCTF